MKSIVIPIVALVAGVAVLLTFGYSAENPHGSLSWECQDCHTTDSWHQLRSDMKFDHNKTGFRLNGSHRQVDCSSCHTDLVFSHVGTACADCHADHHLGQLGSDCASCHTPQDWQPRQDLLLQHAEQGFPLTGVHAVADCEACHQSGDRNEFAGTPTECVACHARDAAAVTDPDHSLPAFQDDCQLCHRSGLGSWTNNTYEHPASFPLTGAHAALDCRECHVNGFTNAQADCYSCHQTDFESTTDPDHAASGFAVTCQDCHSTTAWEPATFDHNQTGFALTGAHMGADCLSCHQSGYTGTPADCYSCHQANFESTTDPDHVASGFQQTCQDCHSTTNWEGASFDHNNTGFSLIGAHTTTTCMSCHQSGYAGTPAACEACHQSEYDATTNPSHISAHFPTDCAACHTPTGWNNANWDHDGQYFPIYSGAHNGRWTDCTECHTIPTDFTQFDCTACHEHNRTDTDSHHGGVRNYVYESSACYDCHPRGQH